MPNKNSNMTQDWLVYINFSYHRNKGWNHLLYNYCGAHSWHDKAKTQHIHEHIIIYIVNQLCTPYYILLLDILELGRKNWTLIGEMHYAGKNYAERSEA